MLVLGVGGGGRLPAVTQKETRTEETTRDMDAFKYIKCMAYVLLFVSVCLRLGCPIV